MNDPEKYKKNPIYGTDFSKPLSEVIASIRRDLIQSRGNLKDITFAYPEWEGRVDHVVGLLTCGIVALHHSMEEIIKFEEQEKRIGEELTNLKSMVR